MASVSETFVGCAGCSVDAGGCQQVNRRLPKAVYYLDDSLYTEIRSLRSLILRSATAFV